MEDDGLIFNYPASFDMKVFVVNDETGQAGEVTVGLGSFGCPTPEKIKSHLDSLAEDLEGKGLPGFRLATKREAWDRVCLEKTGETFALLGGDDWDEV